MEEKQSYYYGYPRVTGDIDIFYEISPENVERLYNALLEFWEGKIPGINHRSELKERGMIFQFGVPPNRIDLINHIDNVEFKEAWKSKKEESIKIKNKIISVYFIGIKELIKNKEAVKPPKDLEDLKFLKKLI